VSSGVVLCNPVSFRREQAVSENGAVACTYVYVECCPRMRGGAWHRHEERRLARLATARLVLDGACAPRRAGPVGLTRGLRAGATDVPSSGEMVRRVVGVAVGLVVVFALGLAFDDQDQTTSTPRPRALGRDIDAHGIGCSRIYPSRLRLWADHDAAGCQVGSASLTLHVWKGVSPPMGLGEASRHVSWVVGPNWLVATTNRSSLSKWRW
jgi:hypothetical protein